MRSTGPNMTQAATTDRMIARTIAANSKRKANFRPILPPPGSVRLAGYPRARPPTITCRCMMGVATQIWSPMLWLWALRGDNGALITAAITDAAPSGWLTELVPCGENCA